MSMKLHSEGEFYIYIMINEELLANSPIKIRNIDYETSG